MKDDLLIEIQTEELPPKSLLKVANAFRQQVESRLRKAELTFDSSQYFATPRRLALLVKNLLGQQPDQSVERKGPAVSAAFDAQGNPTKACEGFARSCQVTPQQLSVIKTDQGEWVGYQQVISGKPLKAILPDLLKDALAALPVGKRMRWAVANEEFIRPVHSVILLYGDQVITTQILGCETNRVTRGHRFLSPVAITIPVASAYASILATEGYVIADFEERQQKIITQARSVCLAKCGKQADVLMDPALLEEVTGLVEWPVALCGNFDARFIELPDPVLISAMQDHQRYFPVIDDKGKLLPHFITISNLVSNNEDRVIDGNERVLRARLADADFFYQTDQHISLSARLERLKKIVFQDKLGTLYDKCMRLSALAAEIAKQLTAPDVHAARAGLLAKTDLTTNMVNEFPELQGVMGYYYAKHDQEDPAVQVALREQYLPRYAGDQLPETVTGQALAIADRIDTLVGTFGMNRFPTGDKDPLGLRRAALGVIRILIENKLNLDLQSVLQFSVSQYQQHLANQNVVKDVLVFIQERLRAWYQEQGIAMDVFAAVSALDITNPLDIDQRIKAVQTFKKRSEAEALSTANKRVSNILAKYTQTLDAKKINPDYFENAAEKELAQQIEMKGSTVAKLHAANQYDAMLVELSQLRDPIDNFFDHVMVMTDNKAQRENRILLLSKLRALFLQVADIALLQ